MSTVGAISELSYAGIRHVMDAERISRTELLKLFMAIHDFSHELEDRISEES